MILLTLLLSAFAQTPGPTPDTQWAAIEQQSLPSWGARAETAARQIAARSAFFDGTGAFTNAFPSLADARLTHVDVLRGRLDALQRRATQRESARLDLLTGLTDSQRILALTARTAALDGEDQADALERKLLTRLSAVLESYPRLEDATLDPQLGPALAKLAETRPDDPIEAVKHAKDVAAADVAIAATRTLQRTLLLHAIGAGELPDIEPELNALSSASNALVITRLWMARPHLEAADQARVDESFAQFQRGQTWDDAVLNRETARETLIAATDAAVTETDESVLAKRQTDTARSLARAKKALATLPPEHPLLPLRTLELDTASDNAEAAARRHERFRTGQVARSEAAAAAAVKAKREAELAAAAAEGHTQKLRAEVLSRSAEASERLAALTQLLEDREQAIETDETTHLAAFATLQTTVKEVALASPLAGTGPDADKLYSTLRRQIETISTGEVATGAGVKLALEQVAEIRVRTSDEAEDVMKIERSYAVAENLDEWSQTLENERELANELLALAYLERKGVLKQLRDLASIRRELRSYVSWRQTEIDGSRTFTEILNEAALLKPTVVGAASSRVGEILGSPWRLIRDGRLMVDLMWSLFWTALLFAGWFWARGKASDVATRLAWQIRKVRPDLRPVDLQQVKGPLAVAVRASIDLTLGYLMVGRLSWISAEIAFLVECWLLMAVFRMFMAVFDLAVVRSPNFRPCLAAMAPAPYDLARLTARVIVIWGIARGFTSYVVWGMLGMDATTTLLMTLFNTAGYVAAAWLLYLWDPLLRERIRARNQESRVVQFLARDVPKAVRPFSALAMVVFFLLTLTVDLWYWVLARDRTGMARVFNVISRYQMTDEGTTVEPLSDAVRERLTVRDTERPLYVKRPGLDDACQESLSSWAREGRRGMVAIIGDRGDGKRTEIDRFLKRLNDPELQVRRHRLNDLRIDPDDVCLWLCELAEIEPATDPEVVIERLRELPRTVFVVEQMHRTFSRTVGGFDAIQVLLYILNATCDHHFWLVTLHRPAWYFLASIPSIVDVGVFRSVLTLDPFEATALRELTEMRAKYAGVTLDYATLMRSNLLGADPRVELERATNMFYRLLADASEGNPRVAMHLFADCLDPGEDDVVHVHRRRALATDVVQELGVNALFALVALRQQDSMRFSEIVDVTNLPESMLRNVVRDLQSRGLVEASGNHLYIPVQILPLVSRTLRRRHLLYLGA